MRDFRDFAHAIKDAVDRELSLWLAPRIARAKDLGSAPHELTQAIAQLATRGGKRLRAVLVAAGYEAYGGSFDAAIVPALVAVELLQTYLLIHDDWMDQDEVRRGGPSVHALLRERFGSVREGEVGAILAGDLAAGYALEALSEARVSPERLAEAMRELARMEVDVVLGQTLDVYGGTSVETVHDLKTNSYTVRGPLRIGASLAGATAAQKTELDAFARPLGIAFQLRDDVLGTFGDPKKTGKSAASDLRQGKRTALVEELLAGGSAGDRALVEGVLGVADATAEDLARVIERFSTSGAKHRVEERLHAHLAEASAHLAKLPIEPNARHLLAGAISALGERDQ